MKTITILFFLTGAALTTLHAQVTRDVAVDLQAAVSDITPCIVLSWTQRIQGNITAQKIHRRLKGEAAWVKLADLTATQTSYADATALSGIEYEYWLQRTLSVSPYTAMGYLSAGVKVPEVQSRGKLLLVIDDTMVAPLAPEIEQLKLDLAADGWTVQPITAPRSGTAFSTKALIKAAYDADPTNVKQVYLLGHVPVPYSGYIAPDGHGEHSGAWPADGYYGDMSGTWTDTSVDTSSATDARSRNIPGDGKFDQNTLPAFVVLQVGRVDLHRLGKSPAPIDATMEPVLLRRYLTKAHSYRHKLGLYSAIQRRSLIRDGFGYFGGEAFAATGWAGAFANVGVPPGAPVDEAPDGQWFSASYAGGQSYLWGHGNGAGSSESAVSLGSSTDFGHKTSRVVFTSVFGSWHGDWDSDSNLMRSVLAGNPGGDSLGLCCFWAGRPAWFVHQLGMGETLGYMARTSMNAGLTGSYVPGGSSLGGVHLGLMGDPSLRIHAVEPPRRLTASSSSNQVVLVWAASTETNLQGYHVYRADTPAGPFVKLTNSPQMGTSYTDATAIAGNTYTYLVRTLKLEGVTGGSYYNLSVGSPVTIAASSAGTAPPLNPSELTLPTGSPQLTWQDNSGDETGFRIERKVNAAGAWSTLATVTSNTTTYTDPGPFAAMSVYYYRVIATGAAGDSIASNAASFEASAGFLEFTARTMTVNKTVGTASIAVSRFGGGIGAVTVTYGTASSTAIAGTHFTDTTGTLSWADGEVGNKFITVPLTNNATPQQARQFAIYLWGPGGGARTGAYTSINVLIEDPTASLPLPWMQTVLGTVDYASPAVDAEGFLGSAIIGGSLSGGSDGGRFAYQQRSGDGSMTAYVRSTTPFDYGARVAVMVRENLTASSRLAGVCTGGSDYGTKLIYRASSGASPTQIGSAALVTPCWVRLTRLGSTFTAEHSANGTTWTTISQTTLASMPNQVYWGIFNCASGINSSDYTATYQLSGVESIVFSGLTEPPTPVDIFTASNQTISINGGNKTSAVQYYVGNGFHSDTLAISNGGLMTMTTAGVGVGYLTMGEQTGDNNNAITIDGARSRLNFTGGYLAVGSRSTGNTITISNGGALNGGNWGTLLGSNGGGSNSVTVTGTGSTWTTAGVNMNGGGSNSISILAGGVTYSGGIFRIGNASSSNTVTVSGAGSLLREDDEILVSTGGYSNNALLVGTGGTVNLRDSANTGKGIVINSSGTGNKVQITGGTLTVVSSTSSTPAIDVKNGALILNSGTVTTERLLANTGAASVVTFNGGALTTQGTTITNGSTFTVGNGTSSAALILDGGTHSFANGIALANNSTLSGTGTITSGTLTVPVGATLSPGSTASPQGSLGIASTSLAGSLAVNIAGSASNRLVVTGDLALVAGAAIACPTAPVSPNTYIIASYTGSLTGTFSAASAPAGYHLVYDSAAKQIRLEAGSSGFSGWITGFGLSPADQSVAVDPDHDGVANGIEYVLGGNPATGMDAAKLPQATVAGGNMTFSFDRVVSSETPDVALFFQHGTDLAAWTDVSADTVNPPMVTITRSGDSLTDHIVITVPVSGSTLFGRLKTVSIP